ncbi:MAG: hypothetical protein EOO46_16200 [Flavobacterium sp.]|nr:MAG: hypothetical protein EOO46_16200 [Flavobacterium sp.]
MTVATFFSSFRSVRNNEKRPNEIEERELLQILSTHAVDIEEMVSFKKRMDEGISKFVEELAYSTVYLPYTYHNWVVNKNSIVFECKEREEFTCRIYLIVYYSTVLIVLERGIPSSIFEKFKYQMNAFFPPAAVLPMLPEGFLLKEIPATYPNIDVEDVLFNINYILGIVSNFELLDREQHD